MPAPRDKQETGFAKIPNALIDNPTICLRDKMILIKLMRHGYGGNTLVYPKQTSIAKSLGISRDTVAEALRSLTGLGLIEALGEGGRGRRERYRLRPDLYENMPDISASKMPDISASNAEQSGIIKQTAERIQQKKTPATGSAVDTMAGPDWSLSGSTVTALRQADAEISGISLKRRINENLLTPDGLRVDDDPTFVLCDLDCALGLAGGKVMRRGVLNELIALRGAAYCNFWRSWLLRKIAAEYEAGRPVKKPSGLYVQAVREGWEVDPSWPEFDETRHTIAAKALSLSTEADLEIPF